MIMGVVLVAFSAAALWTLSGPRPAPSELIIKADIITMTPDLPRAEAIHIADGRIQHVGSMDELRTLAPPRTVVVEMKDTVITPGLIEPHTHPDAAAVLATTIDVSGFRHTSRAKCMNALANGAKRFSLAPWTIAFGWDPVMVKDLSPPTLTELDTISPTKPLVVLTQMMHDAYANSAALAAAGIDEQTQNPVGGEFVRDADGRLTGTVREVAAIDRLLAAMPPPPKGSAELLLALQYSRYARAGYTTLGALGPASNLEDPIGLMERLALDPEIPVRTVVYALPAQLAGSEPPPSSHRFRLRGVKFWMDGSPYAGGAAWADPYENSPLVVDRLHLGRDHRPALNYGAEEFRAMFLEHHGQGRHIAVHVQGERAIDRVLDTVEFAQSRFPRPEARHRLEHNALITQDQLVRARELGVTVSFFIDHIRFYGDRLPEIVGSTRTQRYMPVGSALRAGHRASLHSDNPATPLDPMRVLQTAVARRTRERQIVVGADQRISAEQALRAMTIDAAWQLGLEDEVGSIEPGKRADLTMLSANPMETAPERIGEIAILSTWIDGRPADSRSWRRGNLARALNTVAGWISLS